MRRNQDTVKSLNDAIETRPIDVMDGDIFGAKVVAVAGYAYDWAMYIGPSDWTDAEVARSGNKLDESEAAIYTFQHVMQLRRYRR